MRSRSRNFYLTGAKGTEWYAWINTWILYPQRNQGGMTFTSSIKDDVGRDRVNPLHSYQTRATRSTTQIVAERWPGKYDGEVTIANSYMDSDGGIDWSIQDLDAWATKGAHRARPIHPLIDVPVVIGELTEARQMVSGLRSIVHHMKTVTNSKKSAIARIDSLIKGTGDTGLYALFGVKPIVETLADLATISEDLRQKTRQLQVGNGKWKHVHIKLLDTSDTDTLKDQGNVCWPEHFAQSWIRSNRGDITTTLSERIWFETNVRYDIGPDPFSKENEEKFRSMLLGGPLSGKVLYELAPYSWLADWFTSVGSAIANAMDHTLYQWHMPCVMHESTYDRTIKGEFRYWKNSTSDSAYVNPTGRKKVTVKRRKSYVGSEIGIASGEMDTFRKAIAAFLVASKTP